MRAAEDRVAAAPGTNSLSSAGVRITVVAPQAVFIRQRARSVRIAISVWASQMMPLVWWRIAAPVSASRAWYISRECW
jgi:hypothetical protein